MKHSKEKSNGQTPESYLQPHNDFLGRTVIGFNENVNHIKKSNMRFWYNNQTTGYATHWHDDMEIILPIDDSYNVIINNQRYQINEGEILFIPCGAIHSIEPHEFGSRFIYLINISLFSQLSDFQMLLSSFMQPCIFSLRSHPYIYNKIYSSFMKMNNIYFSGDIFWEFAIYSILMEVFTDVGTSRFQTNNHSQPAKQIEYYEKFSALLHYIDTHYQEELTLEHMADFAGFSKFHFSRLFKQYTNYTFYDYLCYKRVQVAQGLLGTHLSITEVAFQTGFNSLSTFCRTFKKYVNCSPTEYRNSFEPLIHTPHDAPTMH